MNKINTIKCPNCSASLKTANPDKLKGKIIKCPVCGEKAPFDSFLQATPKKEPPKVEGTNYTAVPKKKSTSNSIGLLVDTGSNARYPLEVGKNIIGREAATSQATVKLDTGGARLMSREHAVVEVKHIEGKGYNHTISLFKDGVNKTLINGLELVYPERLRLKDGDIIDFPGIRVRFVVPETEVTQL